MQLLRRIDTGGSRGRRTCNRRNARGLRRGKLRRSPANAGTGRTRPARPALLVSRLWIIGQIDATVAGAAGRRRILRIIQESVPPSALGSPDTLDIVERTRIESPQAPRSADARAAANGEPRPDRARPPGEEGRARLRRPAKQRRPETSRRRPAKNGRKHRGRPLPHASDLPRTEWERAGPAPDGPREAGRNQPKRWKSGKKAKASRTGRRSETAHENRSASVERPARSYREELRQGTQERRRGSESAVRVRTHRGPSWRALMRCTAG